MCTVHAQQRANARALACLSPQALTAAAAAALLLLMMAVNREACTTKSSIRILNALCHPATVAHLRDTSPLRVASHRFSTPTLLSTSADPARGPCKSSSHFILAGPLSRDIPLLPIAACRLFDCFPRRTFFQSSASSEVPRPVQPKKPPRMNS